MPEIASIAQSVQIGPEATAGTAVSASKLLSYIDLDPSISINFNRFRPAGQKVAAVVTPGQDMTEWSVSGVGSYSEIIYPLASLLVSVTSSTVDTSGKEWLFTPAARTEDTVKTFTVEKGGSVRAGKATYVLFTGMELTFNRSDGVQLSGTAIGQQYQDNITLTASPTAVEEAPILPTHIDVFVDTTSGSIGSTKLTRDFTAVWRCNDRFNPVWPLNSANASYVSHVETEPTIQLELTAEADSQGMSTFLTAARAGTSVFIRISATSTVLAGASTRFYDLRIDMAGKISAVGGFDDNDGVRVIQWTVDAVYDATWAKYQQVRVTNKTSAL